MNPNTDLMTLVQNAAAEAVAQKGEINELMLADLSYVGGGEIGIVG